MRGGLERALSGQQPGGKSPQILAFLPPQRPPSAIRKQGDWRREGDWERSLFSHPWRRRAKEIRLCAVTKWRSICETPSALPGDTNPRIKAWPHAAELPETFPGVRTPASEVALPRPRGRQLQLMPARNFACCPRAKRRGSSRICGAFRAMAQVRHRRCSAIALPSAPRSHADVRTPTTSRLSETAPAPAQPGSRRVSAPEGALVLRRDPGLRDGLHR